MNVTFPKSRKDRKCTLCHGKIPKGQCYRKIELTPWDNDMNEGFFAVHAHPDCWEAYKCYADQENPIPDHPYDFEEILGWDSEIYPLHLSTLGSEER